MRFALLFWVIACSTNVGAHQLRPAIIDVTFVGDGGFELQVQTNMEARMAGVGTQHADTDDSPQAREYNRLRALPVTQLLPLAKQNEPDFRRGLLLDFAGQQAVLQLLSMEIPEVEDRRKARRATLRYAGLIPAGAGSVSWHYPVEFGDSVVRFQIAGDPDQVAHWLKAGKTSPPFPLDQKILPKSSGKVALEYTVLGFEHILPKGLDHILFVLGLFLLSLRWRPLLWQVTAFTLAHTVTLAATILGYISLSPTLIEPLIALSIAYVGIENVLTRQLHAWRPVIVFVFGLLHGMGFASVLTELGLPESDLGLALITFNVGVELGQLAVIVTAFLLTLPWHSRPEQYRKWIVVPGSLLIAATGLYWTWERIGG